MGRKKITVNGEEIFPGEEKKVDVNIARLPSHSDIDISITVSSADEPGPVLMLMGGLHGDEINGIEIVRRTLERKLHQPQRGTVIAIPILNVYGFINFSRSVPDGKDVNRSFPGNKNGSLASRVAYYLMKDIIPQIDFGIDFHTGGAARTNYPQVRCVMKDPENVKMAEAFHAPFTLDSPYRPKSLRQSAAKSGKRILVYEGGESLRFDEYAIEEGIAGMRRLMKYLGMTDDNPPVPGHKNKIIKHSSWIRARYSGVFRSMVKAGQEVEKKQVVGTLADPFGEFVYQIKSHTDGYVIGLNNNPVIHQGDALMHIGVIKKSKKGS